MPELEDLGRPGPGDDPEPDPEPRPEEDPPKEPDPEDPKGRDPYVKDDRELGTLVYHNELESKVTDAMIRATRRVTPETARRSVHRDPRARRIVLVYDSRGGHPRELQGFEKLSHEELLDVIRADPDNWERGAGS